MRGHDYKAEGGHAFKNWLSDMTFYRLMGEMPMCSPDLTFKFLSVSL